MLYSTYYFFSQILLLATTSLDFEINNILVVPAIISLSLFFVRCISNDKIEFNNTIENLIEYKKYKEIIKEIIISTLFGILFIGFMVVLTSGKSFFELFGNELITTLLKYSSLYGSVAFLLEIFVDKIYK